MAAITPLERITLLSFRTFGDYVLKAPFLHELYRLHPAAKVTVLTNAKGGDVYPLLDSRLTVVVVDRGQSQVQILKKILSLPKAEIAYAIDDSRTTLMLALMVRSKRRIGWIQGVSRLYAESGYFDWHSVRPWLSRIVRFAFRPGKIRLPEDQYEGNVELELLNLTASGMRLAEYRSGFALPPAKRPETPYIYCAAQAGWVARQLTKEQWNEIVAGLLRAFPSHQIFVHGVKVTVQDGRVVPYAGKSIRQLFEHLSAADLVIAPDSLALHVASLYDVPAIGYFGPAHPHRFRPTGTGSITLFREPECSPCLQRRGVEICAKGYAQCISLSRLSAPDFVFAAKSVLAGQHS